MNKNACFPELEERLENDPKFRYAKECRTQAVSVLPLLSRIKNKVLNLANYALTAGIAKSLGQSIKKNDQHFNKILMESNNMRDEDFAAVLEGLHKLQDIKSITYNKNEFGLKSAEALKIIVGLRYIPYHLEELRLVNCKISPQSMSVFLDVLEDRNYIKRLALVNA
jgi:Ran GTPase-activating protein (RanGAP) involved in mRNA processing and transport